MTGSRRKVGRYELFGAIASGGMATVHLARLQGPIGFSRTVAVKQLHPRFAGDAHVYEMLVDEARIAGRIQHPNVLATLDVVSEGKELFLVMDYVAGESLSHIMRQLAKQQDRMPLPVVASIAASTLYGLHAAHESKNQRGEHLQIVRGAPSSRPRSALSSPRGRAPPVPTRASGRARLVALLQRPELSCRAARRLHRLARGGRAEHAHRSHRRA